MAASAGPHARAAPGSRVLTVALAALAAGAAACAGPAGTSTSPPGTGAAPAPPQASSGGPVEPVPVPGGPASAQAMVASLVPTEKAILSRSTPLSSLPHLGAAEQRYIGTLADHPGWMAAVLSAAPAQARPRIEQNVEATRQLSSISAAKGTSFPPWRIAEPQPPGALLGDYRSTEASTGVPWNVLASIHLVESRMGRIVGPSSAGAEGPMQFIPATWARFGAGGDVWSDSDSIHAAGRLLAHYGAPAALAEAIYHYNNSSSYVQAVLAYADTMAADPRSYYAYYGWQVYVVTTTGTYMLPAGYRGPGSS